MKRLLDIYQKNFDTDRLLQRLKIRWVRLRDEPYFAHLGISMFFAISYASVQAYILESKRWEQAWQDEAERFATTELEPRENTKNIALLTPIIASISDEQRLKEICQKEAACKIAFEIRKEFKRVFSITLQFYRDNQEEKDKAEWVNRLGDYDPKLLETLRKLKPKDISSHFTSCRPLTPLEFISALCATSFLERSMVHLPVHISMDKKPTEDKNTELIQSDIPKKPIPERLTRSEIEGLAAALAIDIVTNKYIYTPDEKQKREQLQVYFINAEGVLAFHSQAPPRSHFEKFPHSRYWPQASYFEAALGTSNNIKYTRPYLDLAGSGIVETACERIDPFGSPGAILGVICTDLSFSRAASTEVLQRLRESQTVHVTEITIGSHSTQQQDMSSELSPAVEEAKRRIEMAKVGDELFTSLQPINTTFGKVHSVPIARTLSGETVFWILQLKKPSMPMSAFVFLCSGLISASVTLVFLVFAFHSKRMARQEGLKKTLLRAMQAGVIEADEEGRVVWANDRAEEILHMELRGTKNKNSETYLSVIALKSNNKRITFTPLLTNICVKIRSPDGKSEYIQIDPMKVMTERQSGGVSRYYGRRSFMSPIPGEGLAFIWVEVRAGPLVFSGDSRIRGIGAFASFSPLSRTDSNYLEKLFGPKSERG